MRFETPRYVGLLRVRLLFAASASVVLALVAGHAFHTSALIGAGIGFVGALLFGLLALSAWRRTRITYPPLVLDERGLAVDDGRGGRCRLEWTEVEGVHLVRKRWGARVVLDLLGEERPTLELPPACHGDAPPEWVAGMIETFRERYR